MKRQFDLQAHIEQGVERIMADTIRATLKNPKESAFMAKFALASQRASKQRLRWEREGLHVPGFLIASITSSCNLHCAGCYSRCTGATDDEAPSAQLTKEEWLGIFREAEELGISFILLAGGEPMLRRDVIEAAAGEKSILFPIFTNGTFFNDDTFRLLDESRNLVPVFSIEGGRNATDNRRGEGVYRLVTDNMVRCKEKGLIFGVSITVTTDNCTEVTSREFVDRLGELGCRLIIYVEYVPVSEESSHLAPGKKERAFMETAVAALRDEGREMVLLSFPGDELAMGGCMAAGREFFHVNSHGGAEPCPFSPYSDVNVRDASLREAIASPLFQTLQEQGLLSGDHAGGCVLYEKRNQVEALVGRKQAAR